MPILFDESTFKMTTMTMLSLATTFVYVALFLVPCSNALVAHSNGRSSRRPSSVLSLSSSSSSPADVTVNANAQTLSDYMAKSHEEKLRAVKDVEDRKNAEIQALRSEIESLQKVSSSSSSSAIAPTATAPPLAAAVVTPDGSTKDDELLAKLTAYQQFMAKYVVKAQEEKLQAVKAAEAAVTTKYQEQMANLLAASSGGGGQPAATAAVLTPPATNKLYMERNVKVSQAAAAGKSRWGDLETQRASQQVTEAGRTRTAVSSSAPSSPSPPAVINGAVVATAADATIGNDIPPEVEKANHGLRADGGVGGPTLAERVATGAAVSRAPAAASSSSSSSAVPTSTFVSVSSTPLSSSLFQTTPTGQRNRILYHGRNQMVSAAAKVGKSRWGQLEVEKATQLASLPIVADAAASAAAAIPVSPEVAAADHGLRSNGGVGGPSLAERVNMGAALEQAQSSSSSSSSPNSLYEKRNAYVRASANAGKSRWGVMEVEKVSKHILPGGTSSSVSIGSTAPVTVVGGGTTAASSSLFDRVNLGAQLLGSQQ